jgi:hypothetical protein
MDDLTDEVKAFTRELGADTVGIASVETMNRRALFWR